MHRRAGRVGRRRARGSATGSWISASEVRDLNVHDAMDDACIGQILGAIRRRRGWRQADLAGIVGISQSSVSRVERGHLDGSTIGTLRRIAAALDAGARFDVRWRGGLADRLLDERHAALGVTVATRLQALGWTVIPEVTFQRFGERGSIDLLGYRDDRRAVGIIEHKSVVHSFEETQRRLDVKARLANQIAERRLGWRPRIVGVVLAIEDTTSNRARLAPIQPLLRAGLPASPREVRAWLADPTESLRGTWFVTIRGGHPKRRLGRARVRIPRDRGRAKPNVGRESGQPRS
jgi:transcriptional regulator with XRE-family HTH domain